MPEDNNEDEIKKYEFPITPNFSPEVTIEIVGVVENKRVLVVVDTGFTGFLQIPLSIGIAGNLRLWGTGRAKLADGRMVKNLQCFGKIKFLDKELSNIISLSDTSEDCLLGVQFLDELGMDLRVSYRDKKAIFTERPKNSS